MKVIQFPQFRLLTPMIKKYLAICKTKPRKLKLGIILGCIFIVLTVIVYFYNLLQDVIRQYKPPKKWYELAALCEQPKETIDAMVSLTFKVSEILSKLNVPHTLCYGTLWGALRNGKILPWDTNVDFCVMREHIGAVGFTVLNQAFKTNDLDLNYDDRYGEYVVKNKSAVLILNEFYGSIWREDVLHDGWQHKLMWFVQDEPLSFPAWLLTPPFATTEFHGREMPVPHDEIEMLKYLYRDNWWLGKQPPGCKPVE